MNLCQLKGIFGKIGTGAHAYRIANIAVVDLGLTILAAILISKWVKFGFWQVLGALLLLAIVSHRLFCVRTTIDKLLFSK